MRYAVFILRRLDFKIRVIEKLVKHLSNGICHETKACSWIQSKLSVYSRAVLMHTRRIPRDAINSDASNTREFALRCPGRRYAYVSVFGQ